MTRHTRFEAARTIGLALITVWQCISGSRVRHKRLRPTAVRTVHAWKTDCAVRSRITAAASREPDVNPSVVSFRLMAVRNMTVPTPSTALSAMRLRHVAASVASLMLMVTSAAAPLTGRWDLAAQADSYLTRTGSLGVEVGDPNEEFGNIEDVAVGGVGGALFLLDRMNHRLMAFTRNGQFITQTGRSGRGPGEFGYAGAVGLSNRQIYVLDRRNLRITTYRLEQDSLVLKAESRVPFQAHDMCVLDGRVFLLGYHQGRLLHQLDLNTGEVAASFGRPFAGDDPGMAALTAFGLVLCDEESQSLYVTANSIPIVRRYNRSGQLVWESAVEKVSSVITRTRHGVRYGPPADGSASEVTISLVAAPGGRLLLQFGKVVQGIATLQEIVEVTSVFYDKRTGKPLERSSRLPRLDATDGAFAYSHGSDPFPQLRMYRWR